MPHGASLARRFCHQQAAPSCLAIASPAVRRRARCKPGALTRAARCWRWLSSVRQLRALRRRATVASPPSSPNSRRPRARRACPRRPLRA